MSALVAKEGGLKFHPELLRLVAYGMFWVMVLVAMFVTLVVMQKDLTHTPLIEMFGYNNICIFWDYSPAREVAALIYAFVEVPLVGYLFLNFLSIRESWQAGNLSSAMYWVSVVAIPTQMVLCLLFRMIFVIEAFVNVKGHTFPFIGLQLCLALTASVNLMADYGRDLIPFESLVGAKRARVGSILYVVCLLVVTATKITNTLLIFHGSNGLFDPKSKAQTLDFMWMLLAAVCPIGISFYQFKHTPPMYITLDLSSYAVVEGANP